MRETVPTNSSSRWWLTILWWAATVITLVLVDDMITGPVFWLLSLVSRPGATIVAFVASFVFQVWLSWAGMNVKSGGRAEAWTNRLMGARKMTHIEENQESLRRHVVSMASAIVVSPLIGGVLPVLLLHRRGLISVDRLRRLAFVTAAIYATEFALIHGGYGMGAVVRVIVGRVFGWSV